MFVFPRAKKSWKKKGEDGESWEIPAGPELLWKRSFVRGKSFCRDFLKTSEDFADRCGK